MNINDVIHFTSKFLTTISSDDRIEEFCFYFYFVIENLSVRFGKKGYQKNKNKTITYTMEAGKDVTLKFLIS